MGMERRTDGAELHETENVLSDSEVAFHVRGALRCIAGDCNNDNDKVRAKNMANYDQLITILSNTGQKTADSEAMLVTSLRALSKSVSYIDVVHHKDVLCNVFGMTMWSHGPDFMDAYVDLIISLAASSGKFLDVCLDTLVKNFVPPLYWANMLIQPQGIKLKEKLLSRLHSALHDIAKLVPLTAKRLETIISNRMPKNTAPSALLALYVENMLTLETGELGESIGSLVLKTVVDRLVDLDVEIVLEPPCSEDISMKGIFDMEVEDYDENEADIEKIGHEVSKGFLSQQRLSGNEYADRLDMLMVLTCEHLKSCADAARMNEVFEILMASFESTIMLTLKSKFAQFVVFYACSLDPQHCGVQFANQMLHCFLDKSKLVEIRMIAVSYLASYLSRARFLSASYVANTLQRLVGWCLEYCRTREGEMKPSIYRVFYAGCQAVMYVLCFRMGSMMDIPQLKFQLFSMPLEQILRHSWNPLEVCLPSIVEEFLRQSKAVGLFTVSKQFIFNDLLESDLSKAFGGRERLDMFFPFDPCLLKNVDRFIRPTYVFWSMVKTPCADEEADGPDGDSGDEGDDDISNPNIGSFMENATLSESSEDEMEDGLDAFESSMNKMSITPRKDSLANGLSLPQMPARIQPSTSPW